MIKEEVNAVKTTQKRPRGTQDVLPKETYKWQFVEDKLLQTAKSYGFKEIRVPTFEYTDLYYRSVGGTSDVVEKEMYTFEDKGSRMITLRPEGTAGVVRAVIENKLLNDGLPLKLAYILSCFRYEKPDSGRLREFHQFGIELFGPSNAQADFEVIDMAIRMLKNVGILEFSLNINSIGCKKCRGKYKEELIRYMMDNKTELCEVCQTRLIKNPLRILDCKEEKCKRVVKEVQVIQDFLCEDCKEHFEMLQKYLDQAKIEYKIDPKIVRGLDYYNKTVFEVIVKVGDACLTVCGGGRYDDLISDLGGVQTSAFGFGLGLERLMLVLENKKCIEIKDSRCDIYVISLNDRSRLYSVGVMEKLRQEGYIVENDLMGRSLKAQMKYANKISAKYVMVIGDEEIEKGKAFLKEMKTSEQKEIKI